MCEGSEQVSSRVVFMDAMYTSRLGACHVLAHVVPMSLYVPYARMHEQLCV